MYNHPMPTTHEIRQCESCGLRYPIAAGHDFGTRCPICMGNTRLLHSRNLIADPKPDRPASDHPCAILLDNIRSAWNVGSIFRSADGFGFTHAYLCGITPTPEKDSVKKTALGAENTISWSYHKDAVKQTRELKQTNWHICALEEDPRARNIRAYTDQTKSSRLLIVGNEITGVDPDLLDLCDEIFYIPMRGEKKSFNVAMAFSIAAYQMQAE
jgi:tRNA G18 (ribose-2'-O)-methylase SpoU